MHIPIIYEDDHVFAVNKPNDVLVHKSHYARNITDHTLIELLQQQTQYHSLMPIHRLDRKTSGVILFAKEKEYLPVFSKLFEHQAIHKTYKAIVRGHTPSSGEIDTPIKRDDNGVYKAALTHYKTLATVSLPIPVKPYDNARYSLIELMPKTGRMHQLRKHMNKISHPIVGDHKYGDRFHNRMFVEKMNLSTLLLHATKIEFIHPYSNQVTTITAPLPQPWDEILNKLDWQKVSN